MCLAVPGKIISIDETTGMRVGRVDYGGVTRDAVLDFVPEAALGDYVLVHVGFAISRVDEEEAKRTLELLDQLDMLAESP